MEKLPRLLNIGLTNCSIPEKSSGLFNLPDPEQIKLTRLINPEELETPTTIRYAAMAVAELYERYLESHPEPDGVAIMTPPAFAGLVEKYLVARGAKAYYPTYRRINGETVFLGFIESPNTFVSQPE